MTRTILERQELRRGLVFVECAVCGGPAEITQVRAKGQRALCEEHRPLVALRWN